VHSLNVSVPRMSPPLVMIPPVNQPTPESSVPCVRSFISRASASSNASA
jgi:hypothetical protein